MPSTLFGYGNVMYEYLICLGPEWYMPTQTVIGLFNLNETLSVYKMALRLFYHNPLNIIQCFICQVHDVQRIF